MSSIEIISRIQMFTLGRKIGEVGDFSCIMYTCAHSLAYTNKPSLDRHLNEVHQMQKPMSLLPRNIVRRRNPESPLKSERACTWQHGIQDPQRDMNGLLVGCFCYCFVLVFVFFLVRGSKQHCSGSQHGYTINSSTADYRQSCFSQKKSIFCLLTKDLVNKIQII